MIYLRTLLSSLFRHFVTGLVQMPALPTWRQLGYSRGNTKCSKASFWMDSWKLFKSKTSFLQNKWTFFDDTHVRPRHGVFIKILTGVSTKLVKASSGKDPESEICGQKEETTQVFCQYLFKEIALKSILKDHCLWNIQFFLVRKLTIWWLTASFKRQIFWNSKCF